MFEFADEHELEEYIVKQIRMGDFDCEVEDRYEYMNTYNDLYFQSAHDLDEFVEAEISAGQWDEAVEKRAVHLDGVSDLLLPDSVHTERQAIHKSEHPEGVMHWTFCARCLERYK